MVKMSVLTLNAIHRSAVFFLKMYEIFLKFIWKEKWIRVNRTMYNERNWSIQDQDLLYSYSNRTA
jgi:hypothetical protein